MFGLQILSDNAVICPDKTRTCVIKDTENSKYTTWVMSERSYTPFKFDSVCSHSFVL